MSDPSFLNVELLLTGDGADGSQTFTDLSDSAKAVTATGSVAVDTAVAKFGESIEFDGTASYLQAGVAADWTFLHDGTEDYTLEFWVNQQSFSTTTQYLFSTRNGSGSARGISVYIWYGYIYFVVLDGTSVVATLNNTTYLVGGWHHVALEFDATASQYKLYADGVEEAATATGLTLSTGAADGPLTMGAIADGTLARLDAHVDDVRITKGLLRYDGNFTAPTAAHPTEAAGNDIRISIPLLLGRASIGQDLGAFDTTDSWLMRITGDPVVQIPISSWQATLQSDRSSFMQAVIPNAGDWADLLSARQGTSEFYVLRSGVVGGVPFESEVMRAPLETVRLDQGSLRYTATISGFPSAAEDVAGAKTLTEVRQMSQSTGGAVRTRASINWSVRPGQSVIANGVTFTASYINFFVTTTGDSYMDVGSRG